MNSKNILEKFYVELHLEQYTYFLNNAPISLVENEP